MSAITSQSACALSRRTYRANDTAQRHRRRSYSINNGLQVPRQLRLYLVSHAFHSSSIRIPRTPCNILCLVPLGIRFVIDQFTSFGLGLIQWVQANNSDLTNLWRTTPDTSNTFPSMIWTAMVNNNATQIVSGKHGAWNDADMLEVQLLTLFNSCAHVAWPHRLDSFQGFSFDSF